MTEKKNEIIEADKNFDGGQKVTSLVPQDFNQYLTMADQLFQSGFTNQETAQGVFAILMMGADLGFTPMQSINSIAYIGKRTSLWGDGLLGHAQKQGHRVSWEFMGKPFDDDFGCKAKLIRGDDQSEYEWEYTVADAKRAKLWITDEMVQKTYKLGNSAWYKHPKDMLFRRAVGKVINLGAADALYGLAVAEEMQDVERGEMEILESRKKLDHKINTLKDEDNEITDAVIIDDEIPEHDKETPPDDAVKSEPSTSGQSDESIADKGSETDEGNEAPAEPSETATEDDNVDMSPEAVEQDESPQEPSESGTEASEVDDGTLPAPDGVEVNGDMRDWIDFLYTQATDADHIASQWKDEQKQAWVKDLGNDQRQYMIDAGEHACSVLNGDGDA